MTFLNKVTIIVCFLPCAASAQHSTVPVILLDGYEWNCSPPLPTALSYFGQLQTYLLADGARAVGFFGNCEGGSKGIDLLADDFGHFLANFSANYASGGPVDVIAHSMGGLIVRSYLAGLNLAANTVTPPLNPPIHKLVFIGTPHFGTDFHWPIAGSLQVSQMQYGSQLTWDLATWNQQLDDLRGIESIAIAGNANADADGVISDGVVAVQSASLDFVSANRTRVIPYCHIDIGILDGFFCTGGPSIVNIQSPQHWTYLIIRSFLDGDAGWQSIGISPAQATKGYGGMIWGVQDSNGQAMAVTSPQLTSAGLNYSLLPGAGAWYVESASPDPNGVLTFTAQGQSHTQPQISVTSGAFIPWISKFGPLIDPGYIVPSAGIPPGPYDVAADSLITIYGGSLATATTSAPFPWPAQLAGTTVTIDSVACPINYASPTQVNALTPSGLARGLHTLKLQNSQGSAIFNLMIDPIVPALFSSPAGGTNVAALHSNYQAVSPSNPAARGETISLFATGLGAVSTVNGLQYANTIPAVFINGVSAEVTYAGRAPGYQGLDQINVQIPTSIPSGTSVPVWVTSGGRTSNQVLLAIK